MAQDVSETRLDNDASIHYHEHVSLRRERQFTATDGDKKVRFIISGLTYQDIAESMDESVNPLESRLHRAHSQLKEGG